MNIIISPFSKNLRNDKDNPKNYPWWEEVINKLHDLDFKIMQIGIKGESKFEVDEYYFDTSFSVLKELLINWANTWISVDNFFPHFCNLHNIPGIVIFGQSDPKIFGYSQNKNLLKDRSFLRPDQYGIWETAVYRNDCFVTPEIVVKNVKEILEYGH